MKSKALYITEVGPRDGLQNEKEIIPTDKKIDFIDLLSDADLQEIEVTSFVSPKMIPQLADAEEVCKRIKRNPNVIYSALVPNELGLERALACQIDKIAVFTAASESFNQKNIHASIEESIHRFRPVIKKTKGEGLFIRGYISTAFHCPYEGLILPEKTVALAKRLLEEGVDEISIGDTIGKATAQEVRNLLMMLLKEVASDKISLHFHDTYGRAIENALVAFNEFELYRFDSSVGGLGGCPYAPGASGNVATEDLIEALEKNGGDSSIRIENLLQAVHFIAPLIPHPIPSKLYRNGRER